MVIQFYLFDYSFALFENNKRPNILSYFNDFQKIYDKIFVFSSKHKNIFKIRKLLTF